MNPIKNFTRDRLQELATGDKSTKFSSMTIQEMRDLAQIALGVVDGGAPHCKRLPGATKELIMDINTVSRALHALNMIYFKYAFWAGVGSGMICSSSNFWSEVGKGHSRQALRFKALGLIEHDRIMTHRKPLLVDHKE